MKKIIAFLAISTLLPLLLSSCSTQQKPQLTTISIKFDISADANPNQAKRPSPVVISMHQLRNGSGYLQATLIKLFQNPSAALGNDHLNTQKFGPFFPGTQANEKIIINDETQAIGFLAELSDFESANARALVNLNKRNDDIKIRVVVEKGGISAYLREN